jgi:hypothetical protein
MKWLQANPPARRHWRDLILSLKPDCTGLQTGGLACSLWVLAAAEFEIDLECNLADLTPSTAGLRVLIACVLQTTPSNMPRLNQQLHTGHLAKSNGAAGLTGLDLGSFQAVSWTVFHSSSSATEVEGVPLLVVDSVGLSVSSDFLVWFELFVSWESLDFLVLFDLTVSLDVEVEVPGMFHMLR